MVINCYLDDTLLQSEPIGLRTLTEVIEKDFSLHGYVVKYNTIKLTFWGDGYLYIKNKIKQSQYEARISVKLEMIDAGGYTDTINAYFFTTDINFDATKNTFEMQLEDKNYGAYLKAGAKEQISPKTAVTKNGEIMTPMTATAITLFTPSTGADLGTDAKVYEIRELMLQIITYLSDGLMSADVSMTLATASQRFGLTKHYFIQTRGTDPDNQISFQDLMDFYYRAFGIMFWIDQSAETPEMNFALESELMEDAGDVRFENVSGLIASFDQERFYSTIALGSAKENIDQTGGTYQLPKTPLVGFGEENVNVRSNTTLDNELDLSIDKFICGTNKIEELLTSTSYIEDHVIIQYTGLTDNATKGTYGVSGANRLYNEQLLNKNILARHNVGSTMVSEISTDTEGFLAYKTADASVGTFTPMIFNDDSTNGFDTGANYNTVTGVYTIPANGYYRFQVNIWLNTTSLISLGGIANGVRTVITGRKNASTISSETTISYGTGIHNFSFEFEDFFNSGDTVDVQIVGTFETTVGTGSNVSSYLGTFTFTDADGRPTTAGCNFNTVFVYNSGGAVANPDSLDYPAVLYNFKQGISIEDWKTLRARPIQGVTVNTDGKNDTLAWVKKISRNWITGESDITLFTKLSENNIM